MLNGELLPSICEDLSVTLSQLSYP